MTLASVDFKTEFAVDMTCQSVSCSARNDTDFQCVDAVSKSLRDLPGLERYDIDLEGKRVTITGRTPPSQLFAALKSTERQVIVRGASAVSSSTPAAAAVSILESPLPIPTSMASTSNSTLAKLPDLPGMNEEEHTQKVFGICRFVQIAPKIVLMDLTVRLPPPVNVGLNPVKNPWNVYVSSTGDMTDPPRTTGKTLLSLGQIQPDKDGYGDMFREVPGELWEWVGRGCVVEASSEPSGNVAKGGIGRLFAGVIARSAGAWGNDKTVCACSGRTMWEEGRDMEKISSL